MGQNNPKGNGRPTPRGLGREVVSPPNSRNQCNKEVKPKETVGV